MGTKKKEVVKKQNTGVTVITEGANLDDWGQAPQVSSRDTIIPRVMLMQLMSKQVADDQAAYGELRDSLTMEKLGSATEPLEIIPFHFAPVWIEKQYNKDEDEYKYLRTVVIDSSNDNLPFEDEEHGISRIRTLQFFVILPSVLSAEGNALPKIVSFRSTSLRNGRKLSTQMYMTNRAAGLSPAGMVMKLTVKKTENDKGKFAVMDVEPSRKATDIELAEAFKWFKAVKSDVSIKTDDRDLDADVKENTEDTGKF